MLEQHLFNKFNQPTPRYTSYPTVPVWKEIASTVYAEKLGALKQTPATYSLYIHIPFCRSMCLYCGCSVILNRKKSNESEYVDYLCREIDLVADRIGKKQKVEQLHFGGGTPTQLSIEEFGRLFEKLNASFSIDFSKEVAIEIDPRTVLEDQGAKLHFLAELGFNRVSFGVQDTNAQVQEAVKRRQTLEMTQRTFALARKIGFEGINIDLIYGLPYQTEETFRQTIAHILEMQPDRIALFSYAHVPNLKTHQRAMPESAFPKPETKFQIYAEARQRLVNHGYVAIGMDHFAKDEDELARCFKEKKLMRNFLGYTTHLTDEMIGIGVTAIGFVSESYFQNLKELKPYYRAIDQGELPIQRGKILTLEDQMRKWTIHTLMCHFEIKKEEFFMQFHLPFDQYFAESMKALEMYEEEGLIKNSKERIVATPLGELLIRRVATAFDAYLGKSNTQFSKTI